MTALIDELDEHRSLAGARAAVGIAGDRAPSLSSTRGPWYPLLAMGALLLVADLQSVVLVALGPEVTVSLGVSKAELTAALVFKTVVVAAAGVPAAALVQRRGGRGGLCIVAVAVLSVMALVTTFATTLVGLLLLMAASAVAGGAIRAVQPSLLVDTYSPAVRVRVLSIAQAAIAAGAALAALLVLISTSGLALTWRGTFLVVGAVSLVAALIAVRLRDPGYGGLDVSAVADSVRAGDTYFGGPDATAGGADPGGVVAGTPADDPATRLGAVETCRRILLIPTMRRVLVADSLIGVLLTPFVTYLAFFLRDRWHVGPGGRALVAGTLPLAAVVGVCVFARFGENVFRRSPARLLRMAAGLVAAAAVLLVLAVASPWYGVSIALFALMQVPVAIVLPILTISVLSVVSPRMRPQAMALHAAVLLGVGGVTGVMLLGSVDRRFGTAIALGLLALPAVVGGFVARAASQAVEGDIDRLLEEIVESEELRSVHATGRHLPMMACRHIDFSYGSLQVLFDVEFAVDEGEMVALLGTNGAGKSTLLRVISGLGYPSRGSVRLDGADVTYMDAERRLVLGISQIPGGRAVFPPLTVVENLRVSGFTLGRDHASVERGIDATFSVFPRLAERRNQLASTLSGGEQQMLGLGKAFILAPRLLLIDELSLGLAPKIVGELLDMVRDINRRGTAVVLVEQSVNVALSLVEHAYFMEKGEVRFDGRSADLLDRPDLLRSVFLEGATARSRSGARRRKA